MAGPWVKGLWVEVIEVRLCVVLQGSMSSDKGSSSNRRGAILYIPADAPGYTVAMDSRTGEGAEEIYTPSGIAPRRIGQLWTTGRENGPGPVPPRSPANQTAENAPLPTITEARDSSRMWLLLVQSLHQVHANVLFTEVGGPPSIFYTRCATNIFSTPPLTGGDWI